MSKKKYHDKVIMKRRMLILFSLFFAFFFIVCLFLVKVMVIKSSEYKELATRQWTSKVKIAAKRGKIIDRYGKELAISGNVYRVDLDLNAIRTVVQKEKKITIDEIANKLATILEMKQDEVKNTLNKKGANGKPIGYAILKRRIEANAANSIKELKINGIIISPDTKRYYPNNNFLSQVLGHTNSDGKGLTGIEYEYDKYLAGAPGELLEERDRNQKELPYSISQYYAPVNGKDVMLTIDHRIQQFAEKAANQALADNKAKAVSIIVMDPKSGEILAMANTPGYNPNEPWKQGLSYDELQKDWRNRAVSDTFEPGSIFKPVTAIAAMQEKIVTSPDQHIVDCNGSYSIGGGTIHCWKRTGHGTEKFIDILKNSCNVGFAMLGEKLQAEKLNKYIKLMGFGKKTGVDLPGEANGIVKATDKTTTLDLATISFGQTNTTSMIQYMAAFNSIANGGDLITPHLMKKVVHIDEGNNEIIDKKYDNYNKKRILDENKVKELRGYLEKVVSEGGGKNAFIEGYHIAGKTGTAQKPRVNGKGYEDGKYIASFAGMAPADDPKITVMVSIDEPDSSNYYGGQISAPVAKQMFNDIFSYLPFTPDVSSEDVEKSMLKDVLIPEVRGLKIDEAKKILKDNKIDCDIDKNGEYVTDINPKPGYIVKEGSKIVLYTGNSSTYNKVVVVPNLKGYNKEKALKLLKSIGINCNFSGNGMVAEQSIEPGQEVNTGTTIDINLEIIGD